jgi:hypothetical protein
VGAEEVVEPAGKVLRCSWSQPPGSKLQVEAEVVDVVQEPAFRF